MRLAEAILLARVRAQCTDGTARHLRLAAGLTQAEVGGTAGVSQVVISRWETGQRKPSGAAGIRYGRLLERLEELVAA